jgi:hypothetical protein
MEGYTEADVLIRARELVVFIEAKYRAQLATRTTEDESRDQVIRLLDVAFEMAMASQLFTRVPYVLVLGATPTEPELVTRYRSATAVDQALVTRHRHPDHRAIAELLCRRLACPPASRTPWTMISEPFASCETIFQLQPASNASFRRRI